MKRVFKLYRTCSHVLMFSFYIERKLKVLMIITDNYGLDGSSNFTFPTTILINYLW